MTGKPDIESCAVPGGNVSWHGPVRNGLLGALVLAAAMHLACVNNYWTLAPDSALYLGLARSLVQGQGLQFNGQTDISVTPGFPLLLATIDRFQGGGGYFWINLTMTLLTLAAAGMIYLCLRLLDGNRLALPVVVATLFCRPYINYSHQILTDLPFVFFAYGILYCSLRACRGSLWWMLGTALLAVGGLSIRLPGVLVLLPMAAGLALEAMPAVSLHRRRSMALALLGIVLAISGAWYVIGKLTAQGVPYANSVPSYLTRLLADVANLLWASLIRLWEMLAEVVFGQRSFITGMFLTPLAVLGMVRLWRRGRRILVIVPAVMAAALMVIHRPQPMDRYLVAAVPMILYAMIEGLLAAAEYISKRRGSELSAGWRQGIVGGFVAVLVVSNVVGQPTRGRIYDHAVRARQAGWFDQQNRDVLQVVNILSDPSNAGAEAVVDRHWSRVLVYLSQKRLEVFEQSQQMTAEEAQRAFRQFEGNPRLRLAVIRKGLKTEYGRRLAQLFGQSHQKIMQNDKFEVFSRAPSTSKPAPAASLDKDDFTPAGDKELSDNP